MIQSAPRRRQGALLLLLAVELALAGWWRWPTTTAPIQVPFDYGTGHVAVVSENWRMHGALRHHFLPVMSIEPAMPEWPYRGDLSQEYISVPPLAFILHYAATRALPGIEPVLLGKLLAQFLVAASVLLASVFFSETFGPLAALAGSTFAIWGVPFLLWFANGYFAVNVGLAAQLVLVAWTGAIARRCLRDGDFIAAARPLAQGVIGAVVAFGGAFADYMPLVGNALAAACLVAIATVKWRTSRAARRLALACAAGIVAGSATAGALTIALYGSLLGMHRYLSAAELRTAQRTGSATLPVHLDVVRKQMLTAWPAIVLVTLAVMLAAVVAWAIARPLRGRSLSADAAATLLMLAVAAAPSIFFHYTAVNYVSLHWWFAGTWILVWTVTVCAFVGLAVRRGAWRWPAVAAVAALVMANIQFTAAQPVTDPQRSESAYFYRALGADLPHDDVPLVVTDVSIDRPSLFEDFPYATAYLRRPVLLRDRGEPVRLPSVIDPYGGHPLKLGGENAEDLLQQRGGDVYVAYDPDGRKCFGKDVPLSGWSRAMPIAVCRVAAGALVQHPDSVLGPLREGYPCTAPPPPPSDVRVASNRGGTVVVSWTGSTYTRASHILEAGRKTGQSDALTVNLGRATTYIATQVAPGTYYVRIRARGTCGISVPSGELTVVVE